MLDFILALTWVINISMWIAAYVLTALALYPIAKRNSVKNSWLAFVPVAQYYIIGDICEDYKIFGKWIGKLGLVFLGAVLIKLVANHGILGFLLDVAAFLTILLIMHKFFSLFIPQRALVYTIISALGFLAMAIVLFLMRNTPMQMSAGAYTHPFGEKR